MLQGDIASGQLDAADVFFLIGAILALVAALFFAAVAARVDPPATRTVGVWAPVFGWLGVACTAFALMLL
jgi:hypothetical protein